MKAPGGANLMAAMAGLLVAACAQQGLPAQKTPHRDLLERAPRAAVIGEHGAYNIAWFTLNDSVFQPVPVYEVLVSYHTPRRGAVAVLEKHWSEMRVVALDEIARRCPPPAVWAVLDEDRSYEAGDRGEGAGLRVVYRCD